LAAIPLEQLRELFGDHGEDLHRKARGLDDSPVEEGREVKSIGHEHTFEEDTADRTLIAATMMNLCEKVTRRLRKAHKKGRTVTTKVRLADFTTLTRRRTLETPVVEAASLCEVALRNLEAAGAGGRKLRLVGVQVSGFADSEPEDDWRQTLLFERGSGRKREDIRLRIARAEDAVKDRFGEDSLRRGASLTASDDEGPASTEEADG
jgi:DNA polymerase-4